MSEPIDFSFDARCIPLLAPMLAGEREPRYYIQGMLVKPCYGGVIVAATNGRMLGMYYDHEGSASEEIILRVSKPVIAACSTRLANRHADARRLAVMRNDHLTVIDTDIDKASETELFIQTGKQVIDGKFPNLGSVLPAPAELQEGMIGMFDFDYIDMLNRARKAAIKSGLHPHGNLLNHSVRFYSRGENGCTLAVLPGIDNFAAIIMPMRHDENRGPLNAMHPAFAKLRADSIKSKAKK